MRAFQIVLFAAGLLCFLVAVFFIGTMTGDVLWRAGVSILLVDTVMALLWPVRVAAH